MERPITNETWSPIKCALAFIEYADYLESQVKELKLKIKQSTKPRPVTWNGQTFESGMALNRHLGVSISSASKHLKNGYKLKGYYVEYKEDEPDTI